MTFLEKQSNNYSVNSSSILNKVTSFLEKGIKANSMKIPLPGISSNSSSVSSSSSGSGGGGAGGGSSVSSASSGSSAFYTTDSGQVRPANSELDSVMKIIEQTTKANNEWSAAQAQKQMDFQKMMSDTAHQREVSDLKAAGLNPVLSAGGTGASTPNGAQGDTDNSNTRLVADLAMAAIDSLGMTAAAFGSGAGSGRSRSGSSDSLFGRLTDAYTSNKLVNKLVNTGLGAAQYAAGGFAAKALMSML